MKHPNSITVITIVAILLASCASLLVHNYLKKQTAQKLQGLAVATASKDVPIGTKLDLAHLKMVTWPKDSLPAGYYTDAKNLVGRVAVRHVTTGDIITDPKLMPSNVAATSGIMTYMVPQGHRAVTVAVNEVAGVAGFITPNSRVDVVLTTPLSGSGNVNNISKIILQNIPVLATGQVTEQREGKPIIVPTVTLDLPPTDAEKLIVGIGGNARTGSLQLLLRNVIDTADITTTGATVPQVLGRSQQATIKRSAAPRPRSQPKPPPTVVAKYTVEVIKGAVKSTRDFPAE
ncbi:Flp pilus assembly protein CpaB [Geotalea sp. SG265]|uniref:Flp pilus assembly protein CpaB n=1 Tax=Geotalea sp. SG265 TaxID=2922867 RepID=UPI001FAE9649|nr:Flp pilus assembly protein CpaB [Geotalea sp. SG265]